MPSELTELDDLTELTSLDFSPNLVWAELVCYAGLLLKDFRSLFSPEAVTEYNNERAAFLLPSLFEESRKVGRTYLQGLQYWPSEKLPDVCGSCFFSFGLTTEGRYRLSCHHCSGEDTKMAFERLMAMHRLCPIGSINQSVLSQLIYKYYSPNGNSLWKMIKTTNLL